MRLLVQRVKEASVEVEGETVGSIGPGLLAFFGVHKGDTSDKLSWMAKKLTGLRIFADDADKMNLSVGDVGGEILVVSQFTLYGDCSQGRRPSFIDALNGPDAEILYEGFLEAVRNEGIIPETGRFGAKMEVSLINDGPITLMIEN